MNVTKTTEIRTARPVYFAGNKGEHVHMSVMYGKGRVCRAKSVKVQRLTTGHYSIRPLGGAGGTLHVNGNTFMVMVTEGGSTVFGKVKDVFANA